MSALKRSFFEAALSHGTVSVTVIAVPGLDLPAAYRIDGANIDYGDNMAKPIPDMEISDEGIAATLSFHGQSVKTFVPWMAVVRLRQLANFVTLFPIEVEQFARAPKAVA